MIEAIRLRNFRGFKSTEVPLKGLTVLLGPNSAGKSSFGHALATMSHVQKEQTGSAQASLTPPSPESAESWPVNLGDFADLRTVGSGDRVYVDIRTSEGWAEHGFGNVPDLEDLRLSFVRYPMGSGQLTATPPITEGSAVPAGAISETGDRVNVVLSRGTSDFAIERRNAVQWIDVETKQETVAGLDGLLLLTARHRAGGTDIPLNQVAVAQLRALLHNTQYLRASRRRPARMYSPQVGRGDSVGYAGEYTAAFLRQRGGDPTVVCVPPEIPNTIDRADQLLDAAWDRDTKPLLHATADWLLRLELASAVSIRESPKRRGEIQLRITMSAGQSERDITEVGFGISQVLPVIVGGLVQPTNGVFIVDLPEGHLHPRPQAALADFFCALALSGKQCLVETHSEMFFHRLRLRAAMHQELMARTAVYFLDPPQPDGLCSHPRQVGLSPEAELRWPPGFLQEAWETESQISVVRESRRRQSR